MTDSTFTNLFNNLPPLKSIIPSLSYSTDTPSSVDVEENDTLQDYGIDTSPEDLRNFSLPTLVNDSLYLNSSSLMMNEIESESTMIHIQDDDYEYDDNPGAQHDKLIEMNKYQIRLQNLRLMWNELKEDIDKDKNTLPEFFEEFRYVLVTSQLLDETILVSNFYNSTNQIKKKQSRLIISGSMKLHYGELIKIKTLFKFRPNHAFASRLIGIVCFINYMKKSKVLNKVQKKFIIIIVLIKLNSLLKFIRLKNALITNILLSQLRKTISHYQTFDVLIMKIFNRFREFKLYNNQIIMPFNQNQNQPQRNIIKLNHSNKLTFESSMYESLNGSLTLMVNSTTKAIKFLLPFINRYDLENFIDIYNISLVELNYLINENITNIDLIQLTLEKIKKFQKLRRFLLTVLLSINLNSNLNNYDFVWGKLLRIFHLEISDNNSAPLDHKLHCISTELHELTQVNEAINVSLQNFITSNKKDLTPTPPRSSSVPSSTSSHLPFEKATRLTTLEIQDKLKELLYDFQTITNYQELEKVGHSISDLQQTYNKAVHQLKPKEVIPKPSLSSNSNYAKKSKRFSLQAHQLRSFTSPLSLEASAPLVLPSSNVNSKKFKRLSTGLPIPLLTVLEASQDVPSPTSPTVQSGERLVSYDDNYINNSTIHHFYGDGLNLDIPSNNNAMTGPSIQTPSHENKLDYIDNMLSNDDSVVISGHNDEDDEVADGGLIDGMTSEEFKAKLEMNFAMMTSSFNRSSSVMNDVLEEDSESVNFTESELTEPEVDNKFTMNNVEFVDELKYALAIKRSEVS